MGESGGVHKAFKKKKKSTSKLLFNKRKSNKNVSPLKKFLIFYGK